MALLNCQRESSRIIAGALVCALLIGGLPSIIGLTIADTSGPPAFTLDICHPAPGLNHGMGFSPVPLAEAPSVERPLASGVLHELQPPSVIQAGAAPDPPPPKSLPQEL